MVAASPKRARETGRERFGRELTAYLDFWAEVHPEPMLAAYPAVDGVREHRANVARIRDYGRRFPRREAR